MIVKIINKSKFPDPEYKTKGSAGFDIRANLQDPVLIMPGRHIIVPTGLYVELPSGTELQVRSRSGLAAKEGVFVLNGPGTVDSDYRDEIGVILANLGSKPFKVNPGDRIAQGVLAKYEKAEFMTVEELEQSNNRGGGWGHTGVE